MLRSLDVDGLGVVLLCVKSAIGKFLPTISLKAGMNDRPRKPRRRTFKMNHRRGHSRSEIVELEPGL